MKLLFSALLLIIAVNLSFAQEICDNAIDDDGDGFIDLNDDDCNCFAPLDLIPNPDFEDMSCCPPIFPSLPCCDFWEVGSLGATEYEHICNGWYLGNPDMPFPSGGEGYISLDSYDVIVDEFVSVCLTSPFLAGVTYNLTIASASYWENTPFKMSLWGTPDCDDIPWALGYDCPEGIDGWELLADAEMFYAAPGAWQDVTLVFTPAVDINGISIGSGCLGDTVQSHIFLDHLRLLGGLPATLAIEESGGWCTDDLVLTGITDTIGGAWQWYKDGIALIGETMPELNTMPYGTGDFTVIYNIDDDCLRAIHTTVIPPNPVADFIIEHDKCYIEGDDTHVADESEIDTGSIVLWEWDYGDGAIVEGEFPPDYVFPGPGTYNVQLVVTSDQGCTDTTYEEIIIFPAPEADFEFIIDGISSEDGATGGCINDPVLFIDHSTMEPPGVITSWNWDFGGDGTSTEENPTHTFSSGGIYTVTLTVETDNGCTATYELDIIMTDQIEIELTSNEPTCFGFSDGSVTVNVIGGGEDLTYEITNSFDEILNEDNSNTANTLGSGWYYVRVTDGSSCQGIDSIFLDQPEELAVDITIIDPLCYGDLTGRVDIDSVFNATGSYDGISYFWSGIGGLGEDSLINAGAGAYTLTINDENGCSKVIDFEIGQPDSLYFAQFGFEHAYCRLFNYQSGNGVVFGSATGGTPDYTYLWTNNDNGETSIFSTWGGLNPGNYELTTTDNNGCIITQSLYLDSLNPQAAFTINSDQLNTDCQGTAPVTIELVNNSIHFANPNNPSADTTFAWNLNSPQGNWLLSYDYFEIIDTTYGPKNESYTAEVCLVAFNKNGCKDTTCKLITIYEPIAFSDVNIFSPNGDGVNDEFTFKFKVASISEFQCVIVDRWGIVIKEINDINGGWDGTDKSGSKCKDGVYFYKYEATTDNNNKLLGQGTIQLIDGNN